MKNNGCIKYLLEITVTFSQSSAIMARLKTISSVSSWCTSLYCSLALISTSLSARATSSASWAEVAPATAASWRLVLTSWARLKASCLS